MGPALAVKIGKWRAAWQYGIGNTRDDGSQIWPQTLPPCLSHGILQIMPDLEPELLVALALLSLVSLLVCADLFRRLVNLTK